MSIQFKTITEIKKLLRENKISHVELIQETLDLINQLSDLINTSQYGNLLSILAGKPKKSKKQIA